MLRLLSASDETDSDGKKKRSYMKAHGFNDAESAALSNAAYEYKRRVEELEKSADDIKNAHWPSPSADAMGQLTQLQQQKEDIILEVIGALQSQLSNYDGKKLGQHLDKVKRKTNGITVELPKKKIGFNFLPDSFTNYFSASAQACDSQVYYYNEIYVSIDDLYVYSVGSYSVPYNNCAHTITIWTTLNGPNGSDGSLQLPDETWVEGRFESTTETEVYCPVVAAIVAAGAVAWSQIDTRRAEYTYKKEFIYADNPSKANYKRCNSPYEPCNSIDLRSSCFTPPGFREYTTNWILIVYGGFPPIVCIPHQKGCENFDSCLPDRNPADP